MKVVEHCFGGISAVIPSGPYRNVIGEKGVLKKRGRGSLGKEKNEKKGVRPLWLKLGPE